MTEEQGQRVIEGINNLNTSFAVTAERLTNIEDKLDLLTRTDETQADEIKALDKRIDNHDKIAGGFVIAAAIIAWVTRYNPFK